MPSELDCSHFLHFKIRITFWSFLSCLIYHPKHILVLSPILRQLRSHEVQNDMVMMRTLEWALSKKHFLKTLIFLVKHTIPAFKRAPTAMILLCLYYPALNSAEQGWSTQAGCVWQRNRKGLRMFTCKIAINSCKKVIIKCS